MSCRDTDEACDWFFRDDDFLRLMYTSTEHTISAHPEVVKALLEAVYSGTTNFSDLIPGAFRNIRRE